MKKGVLLVNCARGGLVDENVLAGALASGHVGGAALDVFEKEPVSPENPLLALDGFICTPHLGASTEEAQAAVAVGIAEQLAAYLTRGEVRNAVNVPSMSKEARERFGPYLKLCEKLGSLASQIAPTGVREVRVTFAGEVVGEFSRFLEGQRQVWVRTIRGEGVRINSLRIWRGIVSIIFTPIQQN